MNSASDNQADQRLKEAAEWHTQLEMGQADEVAFEVWRASDPQNAVAFAKIHAAALSLSSQTREASPGVVVHPTRPLWTRRNLVYFGVTLSVALMCGLMSYLFYFRFRGATTTRRGEAKTLALTKSVKIELNTASRIDWYVGARAIDITLRAGEVFIRHADAMRRCELMCGASRVWLAPGEYLARKNDEVLDLLVLRGEADVATDGQDGPVRVEGSQGAVISRGSTHTRVLSPDDQKFRAGWREGVLDLNGQILSEVVAEYNRYLDKPIRILDPSIGGIQIGGRFDLRDPTVFLDGLRLSFGLHVTEDETGFAVSR